jgi:hypothetical protein
MFRQKPALGLDPMGGHRFADKNMPQTVIGGLAMRIYGPNRTGVVGTAPAPRRAASGTFSLAEGEETPRPANAGSAPTVGSIDALLALQGVEDLTQRRKRAASRGRRALDALEEIRLKLLSGTLDQSSLLRLRAAVGGLTEASGDPRLDAVLGEIGLRVEVELAKAGLR